MLIAYVVAATFVAAAEFGDKTQMLTLVLATRYRVWQVLLGVTIAVLGLQALAVGAGATVAHLIPQGLLGILSGALFVFFGIWNLWSVRTGDGESGADRVAPNSPRFGPIAGIAAVFFLAEFGDKTQLLTMSIAADPGAAVRMLALFAEAPPIVAGTPETWLAVWLGSTTGMLIVNGLAAIVGVTLGARISPTLIARISGVLFIVFGLVTLGVAVAGL